MNQLPVHVQWPADRFFWALLDASTVTGVNGKLDQKLGYLFENALPGIPLEEVQAAYQALPGSRGKYVACGLPQSVMTQEVPANALTLSPSEFPAFIAQQCEPQLAPSLNLLTGPHTPVQVKRLSRRWLIEVAILLAVEAIIIVLGLERRIQHVRTQTASIALEQQAIFGSVLGPAQTGSQPLRLRLVAELRQLEQTRAATIGPDPKHEDCSMILAGLMEAWPTEVHLLTESLSITPMSITLRGQVPAMADAQALTDAFAQLQGWQVAQPQSDARKGTVDVTVRLDRLEEEKPL